MLHSDSASHKASRMAWIVVILLFFLGVINFADKAVIGFAALPIMHDLHLSHEQFGFIGSIFFWLFSICAFFVGVLSDKLSSKTLIGIMVLIWAAVQFSTVFISTFMLLALSRLVLGAAEGPSYNLSLHFAAKWLPETKRNFGFSVINSGSALGPAIAAPIVVWIIHAYSWRLAFALLGISSLIWIFCWYVFIREIPSAKNIKLATIPQEAQFTLIRKIKNIISLRFLLVAGLLFATYWGLAVQIVWVPAYLQEVRHITRAQQQVYFALPWIAGAIIGPIFGLISDKIWKRTHNTLKTFIYILCCCAILGAFCWYTLIEIAASQTVIVICLIGIGGLASPIFILSFAFVSRIVSTENRGTALGTIEALMTLGGLVGPAVSGYLIQHNLISGYSDALMTVFWISIGTAILLGFTEFVNKRQNETHDKDLNK